MKIDVSIVVPVYKVEKYINQCVDSILNQSFKDFELILVDDGSPDSCPQICDEYSQKDERVKVLHKTNGGLVSAVREGINVSSGDYILFVDSDDWIDSHTVEVLYNKAIEGEFDIVTCDYVEEHEDRSENIRDRIIESGYYTKEEIEKYIYPTLLHSTGIWKPAISGTRWAKLFSSKIIKENTKFYAEDISNGEDWLLTFATLLSCSSLYVFDGFFLYHYRMNPTSITHKYNPDLMDDWMSWLKYMQNIAYTKRTFNFQKQFYELLIIIAYNSIIQERRRVFIDKTKDIYKRIKSICYREELINLDDWSMKGVTLKEKLYVVLIKHRAAKSLFILNFILQIRNIKKRR